MNKYLRRADAEEHDLEAKLEKSCSSKNAAVTFFGFAVGNKNAKSLAKPKQETEKPKENPEDTVNVDAIDEDFLFGNDTVTGGDDDAK